MNVAETVTVPKTRHVSQKIVLTHVSVQPVGKMQFVMQSVTEPSAHVQMGYKEILMLPVSLLAAAETQIAKTESNAI